MSKGYAVQDYELFGQERNHSADYIVSFNPGSGGVNGTVQRFLSLDKTGKKLLEAPLKTGEGQSVIYDGENHNVCTINHETYEGKMEGLDANLRWWRSLLPSLPFLPHKKYISPNPRERELGSPSKNVRIDHITTEAIDGGFQIVKKSKIDYYGPDVSKLYLLDSRFNSKNLQPYDNRTKYVEIIDRNFKKFGRPGEVTRGSKFLSKHKTLKSFFDAFDFLVPAATGELNSGIDVNVLDGNEAHNLLSADRNFLTLGQIFLDRPKTWVSALDDKLKYEIGINATYWGSTEINPIYWKRKIIDHDWHSKPIRYPGKHYGISIYTPYIKSIYIKEIKDDGNYGDFGAQIDFDSDRTHRDITCEISLRVPKKPLCRYDDVVKNDEFWKYLYDFREWTDYLYSKNVKPEEAMNSSEYKLDDKKRIRVSSFANEIKDIGSFEIKKNSLYFIEKDGVKVKLGAMTDKGEVSKSGNVLNVDDLKKYLDESGPWKNYLSSQNMDQNTWQKVANYKFDDKMNVVAYKFEKVKKELGYLEAKKGSMYFRGLDGQKIIVGESRTKDGKEYVYTDGKERIGSVVIQKNILRKKYLKDLPEKEQDLDDYGLYVTFTNHHKNDGAFIAKGIFAALANMQKPLNLGPEFGEKFRTNNQLPLEPTFNLLCAGLYCENKDILTDVYGDKKLDRYVWTSESLPADTTPDLAWIFKVMFPETITDEDIEPYMLWDKTPEKFPEGTEEITSVAA